MTKQINVFVKKDGQVRLETAGFTGKACMEADKVLEALGGDIQTKTTAEYYQEGKPADVNIVMGN